MFLSLTSTATALAASGHLPLLAEQRRARRQGKAAPAGPPRQTRNIFAKPPAVEPITGYLPKFSPADGEVNADDWTATYESVIWNGAAKTSRNRTDGTLTVRRRRDGDGARYEVTQSRQHGQRRNQLQAEIRCTGELDEPVSWKLTVTTLEARSGDPVPGLAMVEKGAVTNGTIRVDDGQSKWELATKAPVASTWTLLGPLGCGTCRQRPLAFDLLQDLSTFRPGQTLGYAGQIAVPTAAGEARLHCYSQTGYGVVPTHYLVDDAGRVQLITASMLNWALKSVA